MDSIILAVLIVGLIGLAFGLLLAFAAVIFKVEVDERIDKISGCTKKCAKKIQKRDMEPFCRRSEEV